MNRKAMLVMAIALAAVLGAERALVVEDLFSSVVRK